jgi:hypothetical protein
MDDILDFYEENKKVIISLFIGLVLIVSIVIYFSIDRTHFVLYEDNKLFYDQEEELVGFEKMPLSFENIKYTFSVFIRINNIPGNSHWNEDPSLKKIIVDNSGSPNIVYYKDSGNVHIEIAYKASHGAIELYEFKLKEFPMQRWTGLTITTDGNIVKIYKDGELYTAKKLNTIPWKSQRQLKIGTRNRNFNGYIGLIDYYNRTLNEKEVKKLFNRRINKLPLNGITFEQAEYKKKKAAENQMKLNKVKKV